MRPLHLLSHVRSLADFSEEEINAIKFNNLRTTTLERVLKFTLRVYEKYFNSSYSS